jgi:hypothetical protein
MLEDVWRGKCEAHSLNAAGFLNWEEMREMEASGLVDIQSHAMTHTWYFGGPVIEDFYTPENAAEYPWLAWNTRPERKPFYLVEDQTEFVPWGYPILEHAKSLTVHRFVPDAEVVRRIVDHVDASGGRRFFTRDAWRSELLDVVVSAGGKNGIPGAYETDKQREERIRAELADSKQLIEVQLDKRVDYICWPGGGNDPLVRRMARDVGYRAWTLGSKDQLEKRNRPGSDPTCIKRMATSNAINHRGRRIGTAGPSYQLARVAAHQGAAWAQLLVRGYKSLSVLGLMQQ